MNNTVELDLEIYSYLKILKETLNIEFTKNEDISNSIKFYFNRDISLQEVRRYFSKIEIESLKEVEIEEISLINNPY